MAAPKPFETSLDNAYAVAASDLLAMLGTSIGDGLPADEVKRRHNVFGPNTIVSQRKANLLVLLFHQFQSPVVYLLSVAAALALYFGELEEGGAIAVVLVINTLIGFLTELKAARSIEALRALGTHSARVRRDGHMRLIPAEQIVPGDIVVLEAGDSISADLRLVEASNLAADESTLTGESVAVEKHTLPVALGTRLADRTSMLFKGTALTRGSGLGVVVAIGLSTELGQISQLVETAEPGSSPLEKKLANLAAQLVWATLIVCAAIAGIGLFTGKDPFLIAEAAIALAVAAIPEGLPIVATLALARGMWRMARQNALIERLSAVETLGATTVILTDKTGTLTENRMTVRRLMVPSGEIELEVNTSETQLAADTQLFQLLEIAVLCNDAVLESPEERGIGDPMELALLRAGFRAGLNRSALLRHSSVIRKYAFDTTNKMMATVHRRGDSYLVAVKGAPEAVLHASKKIIAAEGTAALQATTRSQWLAHVEQLASRWPSSARLRHESRDSSPLAPPYEDLTFLGLIGLEDPARADVPQAIRRLPTRRYSRGYGHR